MSSCHALYIPHTEAFHIHISSLTLMRYELCLKARPIKYWRFLFLIFNIDALSRVRVAQTKVGPSAFFHGRSLIYFFIINKYIINILFCILLSTSFLKRNQLLKRRKTCAPIKGEGEQQCQVGRHPTHRSEIPPIEGG